jgi:hypothetical protein
MTPEEHYQRWPEDRQFQESLDETRRMTRHLKVLQKEMDRTDYPVNPFLLSRKLPYEEIAGYRVYKN